MTNPLLAARWLAEKLAGTDRPLRAGDVVLSLDGKAITGADDLIRALTGETIGRSVAFDVLRGTERLTISLMPLERPRAAAA